LFATRRRLDFDVQKRVGGDAKLRHGGKRRYRLTGKRGAVPAACIERCQRIPVAFARAARMARGAQQGVVVHEERDAVGADVGVAFECPQSVLRAETKCRERVFRCEPTGAAVR
jgi:hypothetical protein